MNLHALTSTEASYLLFAVKSALRSREGLTPAMEQFYDYLYDSLSSKLQRAEGHGDGSATAPLRNRYVKDGVTWHPDSLERVSRDLSRDFKQTGNVEPIIELS